MNDRQVLQLYPPRDRASAASLFGFASFGLARNIVLLGDPGAGKTHLFKSAAAAAGGRYQTVRAFLNAPPDYSGDTIFIDALDEKRSSRGDDDVVDAIVQKLFSNPPAKVRISCRAQDWLGDSDLEAFRQYFDSHGGVSVVSLSALSPHEQYEVLVEHGMSPWEIEGFLADVDEHGLGDFRNNPQDLKMLATSVTSGKWPATRADLFEESTTLWLAEQNREHSRRDEHSAEVIREVAGALCALRLISDIEGFALDRSSRDAVHPDATDIPFLDTPVVRATLQRRVFTSIPGIAAVDYTHRTTAEYLAAGWLASQLEKGLSFRRLSTLLGHDGHPASELRGLHAWLAVFAPKFAGQLINADAYGVLSYGDPASLPPTLRLCLLRALSNLATKDPWFRFGDRGQRTERLAGMSGPEMTDEYRSIMRSQPANALRPLVLEALAVGAPDFALRDDIAAVMTDGNALQVERENALAALLKSGRDGEAAVLHAYRHDLGLTAPDLQLRAEAIAQGYGNLFGPDDVTELFAAVERCDEKLSRRLYLWHLSDAIPVSDIPAVLDSMCVAADTPSPDSPARNESVVSHALSLMLGKLFNSDQQIAPRSLWNWLDRLCGDEASMTAYTGLKKSLSGRKADVLAAVGVGLLQLPADTNPYLFFQRLQAMTAGAIDVTEFLDTFASLVESTSPEEPGLPVVYELAIWLLYGRTAERPALFERLYKLGAQESLRTRRDAMLVSEISEWRAADVRRKRDECAQAEAAKVNGMSSFSRHEAEIRAGTASGWIGWAAEVYLGKRADVNHGLTPRGRLSEFLGDNFAESALVGLIATIGRPDIPEVENIAARSLSGSIPHWWLAVVAGLDARYEQHPGIEGIPDTLVGAALAIDLVCPTSERDGNTSRRKTFDWKATALLARPALALNVYLKVVRTDLRARPQSVTGISELLSMDEFAWCRASVAMEVLNGYPNLAEHYLRRLMEVVVADVSIRDDFLALAQNRLATGALEPHAYPYWQVSAFLLQPDEFESGFVEGARIHVALLWTLKDFGIAGRGSRRVIPTSTLERIVVVAASHFPDAPHPEGGWSGDRNPWDGAEFVKRLINMIALDTSAAATSALDRLASTNALSPYRDNLLHAAAEQRARRRDAEYQQPDWTQTIATLSSGAPANIADFHALVVDTFLDVSGWIANSNSNVYKRFWNEDSFGRIKDPKSEESGRDVLIDFLRDRLRMKGVSIEPEGRMVHGKRADIVVTGRHFKIPVEIKRNYHADVWAAPMSQLDRLYTRDPDASRYGVYIVFWFGTLADKQTPRHPEGVALPASASGMSAQLVDLLPDERRANIAVVVIDVSGQPKALEGVTSRGRDA
ncbi:hypothetical protein B0G80_5928 [Paraburkholderia sp. BL6669N2]|uniref:hypothetical protein n=1 Tax=Paraburkholderia sp. BL6669N2 TaxID=1938807 RepID=UPI000E28930B|nr:hypothetical protein [Paraburkholderia sp. BL6669N2]REG49551.1 hypothetical protein B0G80_5928 [Paraburkholderia sp. BL6669N2]